MVLIAPAPCGAESCGLITWSQEDVPAYVDPSQTVVDNDEQVNRNTSLYYADYGTEHGYSLSHGGWGRIGVSLVSYQDDEEARDIYENRLQGLDENPDYSRTDLESAVLFEATWTSSGRTAGAALIYELRHDNVIIKVSCDLYETDLAVTSITESLAQYLEDARALLDAKCGSVFGTDPASLTIGTDELCMVVVKGGETSYDITDINESLIKVQKTGFFSWDYPDVEAYYISAPTNADADQVGVDISVRITDSSSPALEKELSIHIIEGAAARLKQGVVLYIPYLEYQGNTYQTLMELTSLEGLIFKVSSTAARPAYTGCSSPAALDSVSMDLTVPCFENNGKWFTFTLKVESVDPLTYVLDMETFRNLTTTEDIKACFKQAFELKDKYFD